MTRIFTFLFAFISTISVVKAQSFTCNNALVGYNYVVDNVNNGLLGLLTGGTSFNNVLDTNLNNYAQINMTAVALGGRVAAVKRVNGSFPSGKKAGFVIEIPGTAVTLELLDGLSIRTYLNNTVQETVSLGGGSGLLKLSLLNAGAEGLRRIEFTTTKAFDEIELIKSSAVAALTSIRIYYSYVSDASCDNDCITTLTTNNYASATANTNTIGGFSSPGNVTDILTGNFASRTFLALGSAYIDINAGQDIPAGSDVGFIVEQVGLLGILSLDVLSNITITTYNSAGVGQDTMVANANLADVGLLANGLTSIGFKTKKAFRRVRINFSIPLSLLGTYRVYYGFVRLDNDNDGVPNCLDNCSGDDLIVNSKGEPLDCYEQCYINAGPDISKCPADSTNSVQLAAAGSGNTWEALPGNPSPATINQSGQVQGMAAHGIYRFRLYNSTCSDTISVNYNISNLDPSCNRALTAPNAVIDIQSPFGGICLLCSSGGVSNIVDGNLNNYAEYNQLLGLLSSTSLIAVRDTNNVYPSGTRTGFVVSFPDGLLNASALSAFQLRTYRNGVLAETATTSNGLLGAGVLPGAGNKTRISFVATQPFDKVELIAGNVLGLLTTIRVHNAFVEPSSCPSNSDVATAPQTACFEVLTADSDNFATINYNRTGFTGAACALCNLDSLSYIVDNSSTNYATLTLTAGVLVQGAVSVRSKKTFTSGYEAGFAVSADASLLTVDVLSNISIVTFLNGVRQDSISSNSPLLSASLLPGAQSVGFVGFRSTKPFNEVKLNVTAPLSANLLSSGLKVYYAYARLDSDGDGIPDCQEKCCAGDDNTDNDGDGVPDDCDANILAHNDTVTVIENSPANINVLSNDTYGLHALDTLRINQQPAHGTASVNDNGTPGDPTDDYIHYVPDSNFIGSDTLSYVICDIYFTCSEAYVYVNVVAALKAVNDTATLNEDTPATVYPINNDTFGPEGPGTTPVTIVTPPANGTATVNDNGTPNDPTDDFIQYTPDNNYNGTDSLDYQICDASSNCVTGTIYFNIEAVNDAPVAVNDTVTVNMNTPAIVNVLANDNDDADTPDGGLDLSSLTVITQPTNGTISVDTSTGEITYTPDPGFSGTDSLVYQICDLGEPSPPACSQATVYFNVRQTPVANNDPVNINEDTPVNVDVLDNDSFGFYGPGTTPVTIVTPPAHGTATVNDNGTPNDPTDDFIQYTPDNNYKGTDSLVYQICDASSNCATGIVYFNINAVNDAPVANDDSGTVPSGGSVTVNVLANDNDDADAPDGGIDFNSLTIISQPYNGSAVANTFNGTITYTADPGYYGNDTIIYSICDLGHPLPSLCDTARLIIRAGIPDLSPNILILPSIVHGASSFSIIVEAHEINNAPTDGSEIVLIMARDPYIQFNYNPALSNLIFFNVHNNKWTYDGSDPLFHIFRTNEVIPPGGFLSFGLEASFDPQGASGQKPLTISIYQGGGEMNLNNNTDAEMLIFFGN